MAIPRIKEMLDYGLCTVTGFEPRPDALAKLEERKGPLERYLPHVVGDGREHRLKITRAPGMTSLLTPDENQLRLFNGFPDLGLGRQRKWRFRPIVSTTSTSMSSTC